MTDEEQREYEKSRMLNFAARVDQIVNELSNFAKNEHKGSLFANHEIGVTISLLRSGATRLTKWAGK
jgi:hypothetical protein